VYRIYWIGRKLPQNHSGQTSFAGWFQADMVQATFCHLIIEAMSLNAARDAP